jgi:hypothetical protein
VAGHLSDAVFGALTGPLFVKKPPTTPTWIAMLGGVAGSQQRYD